MKLRPEKKISQPIIKLLCHQSSRFERSQSCSVIITCLLRKTYTNEIVVSGYLIQMWNITFLKLVSSLYWQRTSMLSRACYFKPKRQRTWVDVKLLPAVILYFIVALRPNAGSGLLIHEVSRPHRSTPLDERSARRRELYQTTHNTHKRHSCCRWGSNPQCREASGRRPTP